MAVAWASILTAIETPEAGAADTTTLRWAANSARWSTAVFRTNDLGAVGTAKAEFALTLSILAAATIGAAIFRARKGALAKLA